MSFLFQAMPPGHKADKVAFYTTVYPFILPSEDDGGQQHVTMACALEAGPGFRVAYLHDIYGRTYKERRSNTPKSYKLLL